MTSKELVEKFCRLYGHNYKEASEALNLCHLSVKDAWKRGHTFNFVYPKLYSWRLSTHRAKLRASYDNEEAADLLERFGKLNTKVKKSRGRENERMKQIKAKHGE